MQQSARDDSNHKSVASWELGRYGSKYIFYVTHAEETDTIVPMSVWNIVTAGFVVNGYSIY